MIWTIIDRYRVWRDSERLLQEAATLLTTQSQLLQVAYSQIAEWQQVALLSQRNLRDLAVSFRIAQETPEQDQREALDQLIRDLDDWIAQLEEQIVV